MGSWRRKRSKDRDQGRSKKSDKHNTIDHDETKSQGQNHVLEESSRRLQLPPSSDLPNSKDMLQKQKPRPRASADHEDGQSSDSRVEEKPTQADDHLSQNAQPTHIPQGQKAQLQNQANSESPYPDLSHRQPSQVEQCTQSQPQGKTASHEIIHSQPYHTGDGQPHSGQNLQSQCTGDATESARGPSPKKGGTRSRINKVFRQNFYPSSHPKKPSSDRRRLEKESTDRKSLEDGTVDQKILPPDPPPFLQTHPRADYEKKPTRTSRGRSDGPLTRRESSRHRPVTLQPESSPSRIEVVHNQILKRTVSSQSEEKIDLHAWERHLPQSADDGTIEHEVLTLFEFIEHHVDDYYCDTNAKISQAIADQLTNLPASYLPDEASLGELLERARYKAPIIKHCLISLVVSGMSFQEPALFPLLPDEFTILPRAMYKETVDIRQNFYQDQAFSKFRSLCTFLRPNAHQDPDYVRKLNETIGHAVALCSNAFGPWEARDSAATKRHEHLTSLFHKASRVGVLIFGQPSTFVFDWVPTRKTNSSSTIQVWPRLLRTTNNNAQPLPTPQVIVKGLSQSIGVEIATSHPLSSGSGKLPSYRIRESADVYDTYGMTRPDAHFARPPQPHAFSSPSELPAPQVFLSATVQGPQNPPYHPPAANHSEQRDQDPGYRDAHGPQPPPYPFSASKHSVQRDREPGYRDVQDPQPAPYPYPTPNRSAQPDQDSNSRDFQDPRNPPCQCPAPMHTERRDQDRESRSGHSITTSPQQRASNQDPYSHTMQNRVNPTSRKPVQSPQPDFKE